MTNLIYSILFYSRIHMNMNYSLPIVIFYHFLVILFTNIPEFDICTFCFIQIPQKSQGYVKFTFLVDLFDVPIVRVG